MPPRRAASRVLSACSTSGTCSSPMWLAINSFNPTRTLDTNPHVGLLFFIPGVNDTVRVNGTATIVDKEALEQQNLALSLYNPDDNAKHLQGIIVEVEEAYGHCPRALKFSQLWDIDTIQANQEHRPISNRPFDS